jgi:tetratricopeptide (TPR) repeat protein/TolB-like protein
MSRVFIARDATLRRDVVVKVLPPELVAGLNVERFRREILVAAGLQHPHIVPVLSSGEIDGLPWFTMPFVQGESLRARLGRGPLAIHEVISILREVAKALAYAHEHGVVHRDIKPDNVLITGGTAVVTDFGIAKALAASKTGERDVTLTQIGTSIGTPTYMAPEQAAGDPDVDRRADIYSLGCVGYELLTGQPPFVVDTPQRMLAAHISETPRSVVELRPETPPALANLVMRSLAKDPDERPQSADEVVNELGAVGSEASHDAMPVLRRALVWYAVAFVIVALVARVAIGAIGLPDWVFPGALIVMALGLPVILLTAYSHTVARRVATARPTKTPGGSPMAPPPQGALAMIAAKANPHLSWRRTTLGGAYAVSGFILLVGTFMGLRALGVGPFGSLLAAGRVGKEPLIVTDFTTVKTDSTLGPVIGQAVRANLEQSSAFKLMPQTSMTAALQRMRRPLDSRIDLPLAREIAAREGLKAIVDGTVAGIGSGFLVTVRLVSADSARELASFHEPAEGVKELIQVVDKLSRQLRGRIGESLRDVHGSPALSQATTPSIEALRKFSEAYKATGANDPRKAIALDREAVAIDSNFALAWRHLAGAMGNLRYPQQSIDSAYIRAYQLRGRVGERERLVITGGYFLGPGHDRVKSIAAYEALVELGDYSNTNPMGSELSTRREFARADSLARLRVRAEPGYQITYANLVAWQLAQGHVAAAESTIALATTRFPGWDRTPLGTTRRAALQYSRGDVDGAIAVLDGSPARLAPFSQRASDPMLAELAMLRGQFRSREQILREAAALRDPASAPSAVSDTAKEIMAEVWFKGPLIGHAQRIDALVASPAFTEPPPGYREYLGIARAYALIGRADRARGLLARYDTEVRDTALKREDRPKMHGVLGEIALAEHRPMDAVSEFRLEDVAPDGPASSCAYCLPAMLARAFDMAGNADSTIAAIERYLAITPGARVYVAPAAMVTSLASLVAGDYFFLAPFEKRLGELYDAKGNVAKAVEHYQKLVDLWKNADPELQPKVQEVRQRLARLRGRG